MTTKHLVAQAANIVSQMIDSLALLYYSHSYEFTISKEYLFKLVMAIVSPTAIIHSEIPTNYLIALTPTHLTSSEKEKALQYQASGKKKKQVTEQYQDNFELVKAKKVKQNIGRRIFSAADEFTLKTWIINNDLSGKALTRKGILTKAKQICTNPQFQASHGWLNQFLRRHPGLEAHISRQKNRKYHGQRKYKPNQKGLMDSDEENQLKSFIQQEGTTHALALETIQSQILRIKKSRNNLKIRDSYIRSFLQFHALQKYLDNNRKKKRNDNYESSSSQSWSVLNDQNQNELSQ